YSSFLLRLAGQRVDAQRRLVTLRNAAVVPELPDSRLQREPLPFRGMKPAGDRADLLARVRRKGSDPLQGLLHPGRRFEDLAGDYLELQFDGDQQLALAGVQL